MNEVKLGRPPTGKPRKVVIQVSVPPAVRSYLIKTARAQNKSMSAVVNEILTWWHEGR